jgi:ABC-2 type transport system ATP-binding protein
MLTWSLGRASFLIDNGQASVSEVIAAFADQLELLDVTVQNPPIEEIIVQLYKEYAI